MRKKGYEKMFSQSLTTLYRLAFRVPQGTLFTPYMFSYHSCKGEGVKMLEKVIHCNSCYFMSFHSYIFLHLVWLVHKKNMQIIWFQEYKQKFSSVFKMRYQKDLFTVMLPGEIVSVISTQCLCQYSLLLISIRDTCIIFLNSAGNVMIISAFIVYVLFKFKLPPDPGPGIIILNSIGVIVIISSFNCHPFEAIFSSFKEDENLSILLAHRQRKKR